MELQPTVLEPCLIKIGQEIRHIHSPRLLSYRAPNILVPKYLGAIASTHLPESQLFYEQLR
jgi:hypothetical protein